MSTWRYINTLYIIQPCLNDPLQAQFQVEQKSRINYKDHSKHSSRITPIYHQDSNLSIPFYYSSSWVGYYNSLIGYWWLHTLTTHLSGGESIPLFLLLPTFPSLSFPLPFLPNAPLSYHAQYVRSTSFILDTDDRFGSTVGQFCLLAGLRAQISPGREGEFKEVSQER
jgi:hypothetical protein